jgi:CRISPR/Cas system-associated exonuclease Cas4 (RecB family)
MARKKIKDPVQAIYDDLDELGLDEVRGHKRPVQRIRASEVANCARQIYYRLTGLRPAPRDARGAMYGICGDNDHDLTRALMRNSGIKIEGVTFAVDGQQESETRVALFDTTGPDGEPIKIIFSSRADGVMPETPRGRCLLEIKGMGSWPYKYLREAFDKDGHEGALQRIYKKHRKYEWQMEVTMRLYDEEQAYLLVKERDSGTLGLYDDTGKRTGVYMPSTEERWAEILKHAAYVQHCLNIEQPPIKEYSAGSTECKQCPFKYACHDKDDRIAKKKAGKIKASVPDMIYPGPAIDIHDGGKDEDHSS